jgi:NADH-quinone oxidoreductase subunit G
LIGVDSDPVNWGWLCDKGRFAFASGTSDDRVSVPLLRQGDELVETSWGEALAVAARGLAAAKTASGGSALAVIGGARLPNEDAYAWAKAARVALETDNVDAQLGDGLPAATVLGLPRATIDQTAAAALVITLAPDIKDEVPVLYLRLRDAVRERGTPIVELTPAPTGLSPYAAETVTYRPGEVAALAAAVAGSAPVPDEVAGVSAGTIEVVRAHISRAREKTGPEAPSIVVILGRPSLGEPEEQVAAAAAALAGLPGVAFLSALRRANVHGALDMGLAPGLLPGRVPLDAGRAWYEHHWGVALPDRAGLSTTGVLEAASRGYIGGLVLLGADPRHDFPDAQLAVKAMLGARFVVAVDTHLTASGRAADVVLPAATWAERRGTFTNLEDRVTWLSQLVTPRNGAWPDWVIASELATRLGVDLGFSSLDDIWNEVSRVSPLHQGVTHEELAGWRARDGVVVPPGREGTGREGAGPAPIPRPLDPMADPGISSAELHAVAPTAMLHAAVSTEPTPAPVETSSTVASGSEPDTEEAAPQMPAMIGPPAPAPADGATPPEGSGGSGGLRLVTRRTLWDGGTQVQAVPALAGLHPGARLTVHPSVLAAMGAADGESVRVSSARGELVLPARGDPSLPPGSALLPWNLPDGRASDLIDAGASFNEITVRPEGGGAGG